MNNMMLAHQVGVPARARVPACPYVCSCTYQLQQRPSKVLDFVVAFYAMPSSLCSFVCAKIGKSDDVSVVESQADVCPCR